MILNNEDKAYLVAYVEPKHMRYAKPGAEAVALISSSGRRAVCRVIGNMTAVSEINDLEGGKVLAAVSVGASVLLEIDGGFMPDERIDQLPVKIFWR